AGSIIELCPAAATTPATAAVLRNSRRPILSLMLPSQIQPDVFAANSVLGRHASLLVAAVDWGWQRMDGQGNRISMLERRQNAPSPCMGEGWGGGQSQ